MLHRYAFSNVYSFRERTEVSLLLSQREPHSDWWAQTPLGERAAKVMAVVGANASGKTSLLNALAFLHWFWTTSFQLKPGEPLPFQSHGALSGEPSTFEIEGEADYDGESRLWRYVVVATRERVLEESLHMRRQRMSLVFQRQWDAAANTYRFKENGFGSVPLEAINGRPNASVVCLGAQYGLPLPQRLVGAHLRTNINELGKERSDLSQLARAANYFFDAQTQRESMVRLLSDWDMGLSDVAVRELRLAQADGTAQPQKTAFGIHKLRDGKLLELPFVRESTGTQAAFVLLARLLSVLDVGGLAVIDEFESDLHPHMLEPILGLFASPRTNPHNAQLLFTCHAMEVLNLLPKAQVTLVEKDEHNESTAFRLDDVKGIRSDDNFYAKYMAGAYGAVPQL